MENQETVTVEETQVEEKDWKAEAEKLASQVQNLNKAVHEARTKKPADVEAIIEEKLQAIEKKRMQDDIEEVAMSLAGSDEMKAKLLETYNNRLKPSGFSRGSIERDLKEALLLANKDKVLSDAEKKARKAFAEKSAVQSASVNVSSSQDEDEPELSQSERNFLKNMEEYAKPPII